jgi:hypothetical protein
MPFKHSKICQRFLAPKKTSFLRPVNPSKIKDFWGIKIQRILIAIDSRPQKSSKIEIFRFLGALKREAFGTSQSKIVIALENEVFGAEKTLKPEGFGAQIADLLVIFPPVRKMLSNRRFDTAKNEAF